MHYPGSGGHGFEPKSIKLGSTYVPILEPKLYKNSYIQRAWLRSTVNINDHPECKKKHT